MRMNSLIRMLALLTVVVMPMACASVGPLGHVGTALDARDGIDMVRQVNQVRHESQPLAGTYRVEVTLPDTTLTMYIRTAENRLVPIGSEGERTTADRLTGRERVDFSRAYLTYGAVSFSGEEDLEVKEDGTLDIDRAAMLWVSDIQENDDGSSEYRAVFSPLPSENDPMMTRLAGFFEEPLLDVANSVDGPYGFRMDTEGAVSFAFEGRSQAGEPAHMRGERISLVALDLTVEGTVNLETLREGYLRGDGR